MFTQRSRVSTHCNRHMIELFVAKVMLTRQFLVLFDQRGHFSTCDFRGVKCLAKLSRTTFTRVRSWHKYITFCGGVPFSLGPPVYCWRRQKHSVYYGNVAPLLKTRRSCSRPLSAQVGPLILDSNLPL